MCVLKTAIHFFHQSRRKVKSGDESKRGRAISSVPPLFCSLGSEPSPTLGAPASMRAVRTVCRAISGVLLS